MVTLLFNLMTNLCSAQEAILLKDIEKANIKYNQVRLENSQLVNSKILPYIMAKTEEFLKKTKLQNSELVNYAKLGFFGLYFDLSGQIASTMYPLYKKHPIAITTAFDGIQNEAKELLEKEMKDQELVEND